MRLQFPRVWVVDNSPAIRETITIILADACRVEGLSAEDYPRDAAKLSGVDLLIVGDDALPPDAFASLAHGPPILWLQSRSGPLPFVGAQSAAVPRAFSPEDLRERVQTLLVRRAQMQPAAAGLSILSYPVLPREAAVLARRATATQFPVLVCGEPGTGKARLARAIHSFGSDGRFVTLSAATCTRAAVQQAADIAPGSLTLYVADVASLDSEGQQLLREFLDCGGFHSATGWHRVRLIAATAHIADDLARTRGLDKELFYRLSVLPITLTALRERAHDIPALAAQIAGDLARTISVEAPTFTERALERLTNYLWFGNLAELETVLTRTIALRHGGSIDAEDLLFGYGRIVPHEREEVRAPSSEVSREPASNAAVDLIINELAHEFKNPMVTIKTVAQHLERLLEDETGREQVARLTGEAVDRMDRALENLLQFTRFRTPAPQDVTLNLVLASSLTEVTSTLTERRVLLNYVPPEPLRVFVDAEQVGYAFENLLRAIARDMQEGQTLSIRPMGTAATIRFDFPGSGHPIAEKLVTFLHHPHNGDDRQLPLGLVFAKTLIERNGGRIDISHVNDTASVTVSLPQREEIAREDGQATSPHS